MESGGIINKLKLLALLPMIVISIAFAIFINNSYHTLNELNQLNSEVINIKNIAKFINEMQKERGMSNGYLGSRAKEFHQDLLQQRKKTDQAFLYFINYLDSDSQKRYSKVKDSLSVLRESVDSFSKEQIYVFDTYTEIISHIFRYYLERTISVKELNVKNNLQSYSNLARLKEFLGQIRGALNGVFTSNEKESLLLNKAHHAKGAYDDSLYRLEITAPKNIAEKLEHIIKCHEYEDMMMLINKCIKSSKNDMENRNPKIWWEKSTEEIDKFYELEKEYFTLIDRYVTNKSNLLISELMIKIILFILLALFVFFLSRKIRSSILRNISLLNEYKQAVDRSSIVSKTDKKGVITYANEQFCTISGYSLDELVGQPHNIIRHPDMPKAAFAELWRKLYQKEHWSGIVKNLRKDGTTYTVEATISPILNHQGEIEEFIAIRNDITDLLELHDELEHAQQDMIYRMGEIIETRSMETGNHVRRVAAYSRILARYYGLSEEETNQLVQASPMHDIGKVGIPDAILNKKGKHTEEEWKVMQTHVDIGYNLFKDSEKPLLQAAAIIAYEHHENYDGSGYPRGLLGDKIHIYGRITALADVLDALGSDRVYKKAWKQEKIYRYIQEESGKKFDPTLVEIFFSQLELFEEIRQKYKE